MSVKTTLGQMGSRGSGPTWLAAQPPVPPHRKPRLVEVPDAYLTEVANGRLATVHTPNRWFRGAVHDHDGALVRASQKFLGDPSGPRIAADPDTVTRDDSAPRLAGNWLYGGTWAPTFGHFLVETVTTLWPELGERPDGLVFHANFGSVRVEDWHRRLLELAGWGDLPIEIVGTTQPLVVEHLIVASRSIALHAWVHPEARAVWDTIASGFREGGPERVYISRSQLNERRRTEGHRRPVRTTAAEDQALDEVFADHGFAILHPQELSVDAQLSAVGSASVLAGLSGSGLHQSAFMPQQGRVLELGDVRNQDRPVPMQVAIDAASHHHRHFVPADTSARQLRRTLSRLGL